MWLEEKLSSSSYKNPKFGTCCLQGTIKLPIQNQIPDSLKDLLTSNNKDSQKFRNAIRLYNSILAFTSVSANVDEKLMKARNGVYNYRISGSVHHKISNFIPDDNEPPKFSQIYIYDAAMQSSIRTGKFPKIIDVNIINMIQNILIEFNPYV